jgi:hypothetical protein
MNQLAFFYSTGTKYNDGNTEVNASCIGMAKVSKDSKNTSTLKGIKTDLSLFF